MSKVNFFELFNKNYPNRCPVSSETRIWLEKSFCLLLDVFDRGKIKQRKILLPHYSNFPIKYNGNAQTAFDTLRIVAKQMEIEFDEIRLNLYDEVVDKIRLNDHHQEARTFLNRENHLKRAAGLYWGKQMDKKFHIGLERKMLAQPETMIAILAHELAHIKLLGENRIKANDEKLTDLTTVVFGIGIFNSNVSFQTTKTTNSCGLRKIGYLTQMEWCYALSLLAFIRNEKAPNWIEYLTLNIKEGFKQGERFIENNRHLLLASVGALPFNCKYF